MINKFKFILSLLSFTLCFTSCESNYNEDLNETNNYNEDLMSELRNYNKQSNELAKYIKFDNNTIYIDITKKQAQDIDISNNVYDNWLKRIDKQNKEIKKIIESGGTYSFYNLYTESSTNNFVQKQYVNQYKTRVDNVRGDAGGHLKYPDGTDIIDIVFTYSNYTGFLFTFYSQLINSVTDENIDNIDISIEYTCVLSYTNKNGEKIVDGKTWVGNSLSILHSEKFPFLGEIGKNANPHRLQFKAEIDDYNIKYIKLKQATCHWSVS